MKLAGKTVLLGVCGGIAAFKAAALCSKLAQAGADVRVIMTASAARFVAPLTFQTLSRHPVYTDMFDETYAGGVSHIDLADRADLVVIAPATANMIGKMAHGIADDMLSTTLLAVTAPILLVPAMNVHMYGHPAVQANIQLLKSRGVAVIEPGAGQLACGYVGKGRMAEPEQLFALIAGMLASDLPLAGKKVLVTAGGTRERIDPVRYIMNDSSGKMGYALAEAARDMGAQVTLVSGPTALNDPANMNVIRVESAVQMLEAVLRHFADADIVVKNAAVADYRVESPARQKIKKSGDTITLKLVKNPDILQTIGSKKTRQFIVGFAAETENVAQYAMEKLTKKNCDLLVANNVAEKGAGFAGDTNRVQIFDRNGLVAESGLIAKKAAAELIMREVARRVNERTGLGDGGGTN
ncbi:MAG TPA: bifunctional phosphopantothenoylcysteine decarboxylase/phosphopantothenate--cysteine ligase CoaBC [Bacilli bacterium]